MKTKGRSAVRKTKKLLCLVLAGLMLTMCGCSLMNAAEEIRQATAELRAEKERLNEAAEAVPPEEPAEPEESPAEQVPEDEQKPGATLKPETEPTPEPLTEPEETEPPAPWDVDAEERGLITDMIGARGKTDDEYRQGETERLEALAQKDPLLGEYWQEVLDYWSFCDEEMTVNVGTPPEEPEGEGRLALCVLGYALNPDGTMQDELIGRLEAALACAEAYPEALIVVTGGGTAYAAPEITEADSMALWLTEHGVEPSRILVENDSLSTAENAVYSCELIEREHPEVTHFVIVSSKYHIHDGMLLFETVCLTRAAKGESEERHVVGNFALDLEDDAYVTTHAAEASRMNALMQYLMAISTGYSE